MTLQEAKELRKNYLFLIGQEAVDRQGIIAELVVCPNSNYREFIHCLHENEVGFLVNDLDEELIDELLEEFESEDYNVTVIYESNIIEFRYGDIDPYLSRKHGI